MDSEKTLGSLCFELCLVPRMGFIGGGNMAQALIGGFLQSGLISAENIAASDPNPEAQKALKQMGVTTFDSNDKLISFVGRGILVLAVKPHLLSAVMQSSDKTKESIYQNRPLVVSILAGKTIESIGSLLGSNDIPVVRVMPNLAALARSAASVIAAGPSASKKHCDIVELMMNTVGICHRVNENLIDAVNGVSGSGLGFVFTMMEALSDGAVKMGLPRELSLQLAAQTLMGGGKLLLESGKHPGQLKDMVCSPGGTTIAGIHELEKGNFRASVMSAVEAAVDRAKQLN